MRSISRLVMPKKDARRVAAVCSFYEDFDKAAYKRLVSALRHAKVQPDRLIVFSEKETNPELKWLAGKGKIEHIRLGIREDAAE